MSLIQAHGSFPDSGASPEFCPRLSQVCITWAGRFFSWAMVCLVRKEGEGKALTEV